jgi:glycoside/pentoside/hexuronide:cation symporter, GPH family
LLNALAVLLPMLGVGPARGSEALATLVIATMFVAGICLGIYLVAVGSLGNDIADEHEVNTGERQQALVSGFLTLAIKTAGGVMSLAGGIYLDLIQFPVGVPVADVPSSSVASLAWFVAAFCAIGATGVMLVSRRFEISLAGQREINRKLEAQFAAK